MVTTIRPAALGVVSSGTTRPECLIPEFSQELGYLLRRQSARFARASYRELIREAGEITNFSSGAAGDVLRELSDRLDDFAPAYSHFGVHDHDGAAFGFWLSAWFAVDFEGPKVSVLSEIEKGYQGEVLQVSDHGNPTLYVIDGRGRARVVWSLV